MSLSEIEKREKFLKKKETQKFIKDVLHQQEPLTKEQSELLTKIVNDAQTVYNYSGEDTGITDEEFDILFELMKASGGVVTRKALLSKLWDYEYYEDTRIVDTHIKNIRKKLGSSDCIETVRGIGYKLG